MRRALLTRAAVVLTGASLTLAAASLAEPAPASAFNPLKTACGVAGWFSGIVGKACNVVGKAGNVVAAGKKLIHGDAGGAAKALFDGGSSAASKATTALGIAAIGVWVLGGAKYVLHETADVLGKTTAPRLGSTWFSSAYWRIAAIAAVLTLPFLFAACVQALLRSDLTLLLRAAFGYLPLAFLAVSIAAPLTLLVLAACDQMCAIVASAAGNGGAHFLALTGGYAGLESLARGSAFLAFLVGLLTVAGAVVLWVELAAREAAVYVVVLMLPLAFAAMVWPARRVWAVRAVELLVALILSKFAIVAVLTLGSAALGQGGIAGLTGLVLIVLAVFAPWALMRLLPMAELAGGAVGALRSDSRMAIGHLGQAGERAEGASDWASATVAQMRDHGGDDAGADAGPLATGPISPRYHNALKADLEETRAGGQDNGATPAAAGTSGGAAPAAGTNGGAPAGSSGSPAETERSPGMDPRWQAKDNSWPPIQANADFNANPKWTPPRVWPPEGDEPPEKPDEPPADDHDPLPPPPEPEDGRL
jgi:hypothetical protein